MSSTSGDPSNAGAGMNRRKGVLILGIVGAVGLGLVVALATGGGVVSRAAPAGPEQPAAVAAAAPDQRAAKANQTANFFLYVETLTADRPSAYGYIAPRGCTASAVFKRTERIVWRFEILDVATGTRVTDAEAESVRISLPYGVEGEADFKQRGEGRVPDAPWTWDLCWDVPADHPLGTLDYSVAITLKDGRTGVWKPPALVDPSRGVDSRLQIID